jgi:hypothetical protein
MTKKQREGLGPLVDELGGLEATLRPHLKKLKRADELRKKLRRALANEQPERSFVLQGELHSADIGPCGQRRVVKSVAKVLKKLGQAAFLRVVTIGMGKLSDELSITDFEALTEQKPLGPRPLSIHPTV